MIAQLPDLGFEHVDPRQGAGAQERMVHPPGGRLIGIDPRLQVDVADLAHPAAERDDVVEEAAHDVAVGRFAVVELLSQPIEL